MTSVGELDVSLRRGESPSVLALHRPPFPAIDRQAQRWTTVLLVLLVATNACEHEAKNPVAASDARAAALSTVDTHSRANIVWADQVTVNGQLTASGIRGDGRNRYGQDAAPINEYQSDFCGVRGFLYDQKGESGNLDFDPDTYYDGATMSTACGAARTISFFLAGTGGAAGVAPHVIVTGIWSMAAGAVRLQPLVFGMQLATCQLDFDAAYAGASNARVTRLADTVNASGAVVRRWRVESQGNHRAACLTPASSGKYMDTGTRYYLPFVATITQVRYTGATYP